MPVRKELSGVLMTTALLVCVSAAFAQKDTVGKRSMDSLLLRQKGWIGGLAKNLLKDTSGSEESLQKTDELFLPYAGKIIRHIHVQTLKFGMSIADPAMTSGGNLNRLKRLSNKLHRQTQERTIRNNLFFAEDDKLVPSLLGDNERHFRNLPYIQDARFILLQAGKDSVDVIVLTKDVLSIGGNFEVLGSESVGLAIREDDFMGWGDRMELSGLYDTKRERRFGAGMEYIKRNIGGSFIDATAGYSTFNKTLNNGKRQEGTAYLELSKPLVTRYTRWTYGTLFGLHDTKNLYSTDSLYRQDLQYQYYTADAWATWNIDADKLDVDTRHLHTRRMLGLRILQRDFLDKPLKYSSEYFFRYADIFAVLASASLFRQTFYKTRFVYGFGRNEDVPDGLEASVTAGWTVKDDRRRPYAGFSFQRYYFDKGGHYFNFGLRAGSYFSGSKMEDINMLGSLDYFSCLNRLNSKWDQRFFINMSATRQVNTVLNEPLMIKSRYGLDELQNGELYGDCRLTLKAESVFFSPWSVLLFRFAPFIFGHASWFNRVQQETNGPKLYTVVGGGLRIRNESLVFGTTEFRGLYFPGNNYQKKTWGFEVRTNIRFKYNENIIRKPDFTGIN